MKRIITTAALLIFSIPVLSAPSPGRAPDVELYCEGKTWVPLGGYSGRDTNAYMRITNTGAYLEINSVGYGTSVAPKAYSSISSGAQVTLSPDIKGQPEFNAQFTINRFTGELGVLPNEGQNNGKLLFSGNCKEGKPLF